MIFRSLLTHRPYTLAFAAVICLLATFGSVKAEPLRIMPLGDSITAGYTDNPYWTVDFEFGYRSGLYTRLTDAGYDFTYVGGSPEPWVSNYGDPTRDGTYKPTFDLRDIGQDNHEGYGGWTIGQIDDIVENRIDTYDPDVILLLIGTNQMSASSQEQLNTLVGKIVTHAPEVHLIVGQIIPLGDTHTSQNATFYDYNTYIRDTIVPNYAAGGANISTVDHYSLFLSNPNDPTSVEDGLHTVNDVHPTNAMYDETGQAWFEGIEAIEGINNCGYDATVARQKGDTNTMTVKLT